MVSSLVQKSVAMKIQHESEAGSLAYLRYLLTGQFHLSRSVLSAGAVWGGGSSTLSSVDPPRESQTWDRNEPHGGALFLGVNKMVNKRLVVGMVDHGLPSKQTHEKIRKKTTNINKQAYPRPDSYVREILFIDSALQLPRPRATPVALQTFQVFAQRDWFKRSKTR